MTTTIMISTSVKADLERVFIIFIFVNFYPSVLIIEDSESTS